MIDHRIVFIAGLHRSGTSLLFQCLREHPQLSGFRDTGVPEDEGQHLQSCVRSAVERSPIAAEASNPNTSHASL